MGLKINYNIASLEERGHGVVQNEELEIMECWAHELLADDTAEQFGNAVRASIRSDRKDRLNRSYASPLY
jgi:hypothetical protein